MSGADEPKHILSIRKFWTSKLYLKNTFCNIVLHDYRTIEIDQKKIKN